MGVLPHYGQLISNLWNDKMCIFPTCTCAYSTYVHVFVYVCVCLQHWILHEVGQGLLSSAVCGVCAGSHCCWSYILQDVRDSEHRVVMCTNAYTCTRTCLHYTRNPSSLSSNHQLHWGAHHAHVHIQYVHCTCVVQMVASTSHFRTTAAIEMVIASAHGTSLITNIQC